MKISWTWVIWIVAILGAGFLAIAYFYNPAPPKGTPAVIEQSATPTFPSGVTPNPNAKG